MPDYRQVAHKISEVLDDRLNGRCVAHHLIRNAGQLGNGRRNQPLRVDQGLPAINNSVFIELDSPNLKNGISKRVKTGGF
jgi:hypothetical protein